MKQNKFVLAFSIILFLISFGIRFYKLGDIPFGLYWDEIAMYVDIKSLLASSRDMHGGAWNQLIFPSYGDYKLPVYIWLATISASLFGLSEFSFRLISALSGIFTIVVTYFLGKQLFKESTHAKFIGLYSALMVAISPWSVMFSRTGFEGHVAQLFFALSILTLILTKNKKIFILFSVLFGVISTYSYFSVRFVWPIVFLATYFLNYPDLSKSIRFNKKTFSIFGTAVIAFILYFLLLIPFTKAPMYSEMQQFRYGTDSILKNDDYVHTTNFYRQAAGDTYFDRLIFHRHYLMIKELAQNYSDHLSLDYLFFRGDTNLRHGTGLYGLFLPTTILFFILGLYFLASSRPKQLAILIIWWLASLLPASVPETTPHALRSLNALVPLSLVIGYGLYCVIQKISTFKKKALSLSLLVIIFVVITTELLLFSYHYFSVYPTQSAAAWQTGYKDWSQKIYKYRKNNEPMIIIAPDDKFYLWMMAYGPYSGTEFNTWESRNFLFTTFDSITFGSVPAAQNDAIKEFIFALPNKQLEEFKAKNEYSYEHLESLPIINEEDTFEIVRVKK